MESAALSEDEIRRMQYKKALRRKRRKDREAESEIHDLNIYPMLDMMTIILVFLLKSYSATSVTLDGSANPPVSSTTTNPKETVALTISRDHVLIDNLPVLSLANFKVDASSKPEGANGMLIAPLKAALDEKVKQLKHLEALNPEGMPFTGELSVIADQHVPYRLLMEVLYTAGQAELSNYRFVVIQSSGEETPAK